MILRFPKVVPFRGFQRGVVREKMLDRRISLVAPRAIQGHRVGVVLSPSRRALRGREYTGGPHEPGTFHRAPLGLTYASTPTAPNLVVLPPPMNRCPVSLVQE